MNRTRLAHILSGLSTVAAWTVLAAVVATGIAAFAARPFFIAALLTVAGSVLLAGVAEIVADVLRDEGDPGAHVTEVRS